MKRINFGFLALLVIFCCAMPQARAMSIKEAYERIPHRQTTYNPQQTWAPEAEAAYLSELFTLTDEAMRIRVDLLGRLYYGQSVHMGDYNLLYRSINTKLDALQPPSKARKAHILIVEAIADQQQFFNEWAQKQDSRSVEDGYRYAGDPLVKAAHQKLYKAYTILMGAYPKETAENKQAFFDHLCALDFL